MTALCSPRSRLSARSSPIVLFAAPPPASVCSISGSASTKRCTTATLSQTPQRSSRDHFRLSLGFGPERLTSLMHDFDDLPRAPLAYKNPQFLDSPDGRILRILSEYQEPLARFRRQKIQDTVVFFGSARFHSRSHAEHELELLEKPGSAQPAPRQEQIKRARA